VRKLFKAGLELTANVVSIFINQLVNLLEVGPIRSRILWLEFLFNFKLLGWRLAQFLPLIVEERVVEYPFVLKNLGEKKLRVLDVGCCKSLLIAELVSMGHDAYGIDVNTYRPKFDGLQFIRVDVRKMPFQNEFFDAVIAVSVMEHVGLDENGDSVAIEEIFRTLKPEGIFILTAPFSKWYQMSWQRFYNKAYLDKLLRSFMLLKEEYYIRHRFLWRRVSRKSAELEPSKITNSVCCLVLRKPSTQRCGVHFTERKD